MTTKEFSQEFDTLLHSYESFNSYGLTIGQSIEINEYEKSLYLTKAQDDIVIELCSGKSLNGDSFDKTEEVKRYLQELICEETLTTKVTNITGVSPYSQFFQLSSKFSRGELLFMIFETAKIGNRVTLVKPITNDKVYSILRNPFKANFLERTFRLELTDTTIELINANPISSYYIRYIKNPTPIILEDFENVSIKGYSSTMECRLHPSMHNQILKRAYSLLLQSLQVKAGTSNNSSSKGEE